MLEGVLGLQKRAGDADFLHVGGPLDDTVNPRWCGARRPRPGRGSRAARASWSFRSRAGPGFKCTGTARRVALDGKGHLELRLTSSKSAFSEAPVTGESLTSAPASDTARSPGPWVTIDRSRNAADGTLLENQRCHIGGQRSGPRAVKPPLSPLRGETCVVSASASNPFGVKQSARTYLRGSRRHRKVAMAPLDVVHDHAHNALDALEIVAEPRNGGEVVAQNTRCALPVQKYMLGLVQKTESASVRRASATRLGDSLRYSAKHLARKPQVVGPHPGFPHTPPSAFGQRARAPDASDFLQYPQRVG